MILFIDDVSRPVTRPSIPAMRDQFYPGLFRVEECLQVCVVRFLLGAETDRVPTLVFLDQGSTQRKPRNVIYFKWNIS